MALLSKKGGAVSGHEFLFTASSKNGKYSHGFEKR